MQGTTTQSNQTSGNEEGGIEELYKKISSDIMPERKRHCTIDKMRGSMGKSYTEISNDQFWPNAEVPWSFVSIGYGWVHDVGIHSDEKVGLRRSEINTIMSAMKQIEENTCIKFIHKNPDQLRLIKGQPWLFIARDAQPHSCQLQYISSNLVGKDINGMGDIYKKIGWQTECFEGGYSYLGSDSPQVLVFSQTPRLNYLDQNDIGFAIHELLHALGLGHTQKRQDSSQHIEIKWNNIEPSWQDQYESCFSCSLYNDYNTKYDCMSIMHYRDYMGLTQDALNNDGKSMVARRAGCDLSSSNNVLTNTDVGILNKMYCSSSPLLNAVISTNYPQQYPDNEDKEYPITVDEGHVVKITFTNFDIEPQSNCAFDWVQVLDGDGTILLDMSCGELERFDITSKTNHATIKFHSDGSERYTGFRAVYKAVKPIPPPVNGVWSDWRRYGPCSNQKDGKSPCYMKRFRFCNNPAPQHGGADCPGSNEDSRLCNVIHPNRHPNCVIVGGWTSWSISSCNSDCTLTRTRSCTNPSPVNAKECAGADIESSGCTGGDCLGNTITSPNYPNNYNNNELITTPIEVPIGYTIELSFTAFDVEYQYNCWWDYLKVIDSDGTTELAKLCGDSLPSPIKSSGNKLTLVFRSDHIVPRPGYKASWKKVSLPQAG